MTPEAQRIAIAEACGWKFRREFTNSVGGLVKEWIKEGIGSAMIWELPDYLNDLNAMHEAEKALTGDDRSKYFDFLSLLSCDGRPKAKTKEDELWEMSWFCCRAPAAQRAEALLRTLGLWK